MPPRKASSSADPAAGSVTGRTTRSASSSTRSASAAKRSTRTTASRKQVIDSDSEEDQTQEQQKNRTDEPDQDGNKKAAQSRQSVVRPVRTRGTRASSSTTNKVKEEPQETSIVGNTTTSSEGQGQDLEVEVSPSSMDTSTTNRKPSRSASAQQQAQIVEHDGPASRSRIEENDRDEGSTASESIDEPLEQPTLESAPTRNGHAEGEVVSQDPDKSDSIDADATFVAPTKSARPSAESLPVTPAAKLARFSLLSSAVSSPPVTPSSKTGSVGAAGTSSTPPAPSKPNTRLVIHKLVLKDFKSYAGVQTIGPFHKSFSSVVGPNGSGKSNVIDALLFVFGWRANKMRQGKLSELIHSSSIAGRAKPSETQVSVVFREIEDLPGPDAFRVVPKSKLVVSRTASQNNASVYHLNGKKSSFTEVTTLLRERGIDLDHKRFLILQGEVESIAQMPPKARTEHEEGLLEYLEDIIGTSRFKEEIETAAKTVDECNEQRGERLGRLKIVQREKDALEGKKREAESLLRDQNLLTQRQSAFWQIYKWECQTALEKASAEITSLDERIAQEREKHKDAQANVTHLESSFAAAQKEWEEMRKGVEKLAKEVEKCEKEDLQLEEKRKHLEGKKKKLSKAMSEDKHNLSEARTTFSSSQEDIQRLRDELQQLESSLEAEEASLDSIRDSLKSKTGHFSEQIEAKQRELAPWTDRVKEKEGVRDVKKQEIQLIRDREQAREKEMDDAREVRQRLKDEMRGKQTEVQELQEEKGQVGEAIKKASHALQQAKAEEGQLRSKLSSALARADDAKSAQQATASQSSVLTSLARQAELGMIKGFHGRLGSLGVIDDKYDVAISTACPGLDSIVVETVDCGQACIEHLRKNNLGRANFILLDSIRGLAVEPVQTPENVPRLVDLVRPKEARFMPAFYHQLRDTLVARDLPHANRIAYGAKRWRVVTLDGQLIDKSGTMSGGGTRVARGGMSSKFADAEYTPEQVVRLQQDAARLNGELQALALKVQRLEVELRDLNARPGQIDVEIEKAQMAAKVGLQRLEEAHQRVQELKGQSQPDATDSSRQQELEREVEVLESEIVQLQSKAKTFESDIAALQEKILEAGGVGLQTQQYKVQSMREMIDLTSERLTKAEVAKSKAEKDIAKLESSSSKRETSFAELDKEMSGLTDNASDKGQAVEQARALLGDKQHELEGKQEERDGLKEALDESSGMINAFRSLEVEIKQRLDDNERSVSDNEKRVRHWDEKLSGLELHIIDGDEDDEAGAEEHSTTHHYADQEGAEGEHDEPDSEAERADPDGTTEIHVEPKAKVSKPTTSAERQTAASHGLPTYSAEQLSSMRKEDIKEDIGECEERVRKGSGNLAVLIEYRKREQEFLARAKDLEQTTQERDAAKNHHDVLRKQRLDEFMAGFGTISSKLKEMYQTITLGGNAELELVDSLDPFSEGILFSVMPPKKSWKNISNLSGGEKTLSSLALVFALHAFKPTPLYVMDEIDAALDFRNVSIVANLIKERTKNAQFVIISLRNNMFELASRLVGIYKTNGQTKSLAVENTELSQAMAEEAAMASAALAASARKAKAYPNPPKTPAGATVAQAQRLQQSLARQSIMRVSASQGGGLGDLAAMPTTPSNTSNPLRRTQMSASASQQGSMPMSMSMSSLSSRASGLPQTPFAIPQTPRMPKSILARTPRVPSATPRVPSDASQRSSGESASSAAGGV